MENGLEKTQRVRDPVHGLLVFKRANDLDQLMWELLNAREFQRLRRVRQLGFSEFVFPGATHTRFAHSVGVCHTARQIVGVLQLQLGNKFKEERARAAICAALLHDLGHGPFSHTFEGVLKERKINKKHEKWTTEIIQGDTEIREIFESRAPELLEPVVTLLTEEVPTDIYSSIVHSQFDADRLDYLRRDKMMTGTEHGGFDWEWLIDCLEIATVNIGGEGDEDPQEVEALALGRKGLQAAEGYLLGRFHLYTQVYMHKTTRAAEKMLAALLSRVAVLVSDGHANKTGLANNHPLVLFIANGYQMLCDYVTLEDSVIWAALVGMADAEDQIINELAQRLRERRLYKCLDVGANGQGDIKPAFRKKMREAREAGHITGEHGVLEDRQKVSAYKIYDFESKGALEKIMIRPKHGDDHVEDVAVLSPVVKALEEEDLFRVYAKDNDTMDILRNLLGEVT